MPRPIHNVLKIVDRGGFIRFIRQVDEGETRLRPVSRSRGMEHLLTSPYWLKMDEVLSQRPGRL